jgi:hypothetical protein
MCQPKVLQIIVKSHLGVFAVLFSLFQASACGDASTQSVPGPDMDACKVLFIGNSLTYFNDQPMIVEQMALAAGKNVYVDQAMMGGARLEDHAERSATLMKIAQFPWDVVVLQQAIGDVAFFDSQTDITEPIEALVDSVHSSNEAADIVYFLDYSLRGGLYWYGEYYTYEASQQMLYDGTLQLAETLDLSIAPVGWAWNTVMALRPDLDLYDDDSVHPSYLGSYLGAAVYFATIFQESPTGNLYHGALDAATAEYLGGVASEVVLDSLSLWRLGPVDGPCGSE